MNLTLVEQITKKQLKSDIPVFKAGDTLKVYVKIEVAKVGKVRRAKLNYLRGLSGKAARIKEIRK